MHDDAFFSLSCLGCSALEHVSIPCDESLRRSYGFLCMPRHLSNRHGHVLARSAKGVWNEPFISLDVADLSAIRTLALRLTSLLFLFALAGRWIDRSIRIRGTHSFG